jgi:Nif-specific regulatory protein
MDSSLRNLKLRVLLEICQFIDRALDLEQTLPSILRILSVTLSMKRATVTLVDSLTGELAIAASHGLTPEERRKGVWVTGKIFRTSRPHVVSDISQEPLFLNRTGSRKVDKGKISFLGVPILLNGQPIGVLHVDRLFGDDVAPVEDIDFLQIVATLIARFISLNEQVKDSLEGLRQENVSLKYKLSKSNRGLYIVGKSQAMIDVQRQVEKVAPTKATVLLLGESGTGKTLIARIIHDLSERKRYPFIKVNCASIPENLLESELFGFEKGAFTGATAPKPGGFEEAHGGTMFLDEIGELPLGLQAKLLRVLQDKEFERLGSNETRRVDVRIIAATNKNLDELSATGKFRTDLYYRLNVFPLKAPPLRERKEDVGSLLIHFLEKVSREYERKLYFTPDALELLKSYNWPGNVREMENLVERLVIMAEGRRIGSALIRACIATERRDACQSDPSAGFPHNPSLQDMEKSEVISALRRNRWVQQQASRDLGITLRQLGYRIKKFRLESMVAEQRAICRAQRKRSIDGA